MTSNDTDLVKTPAAASFFNVWGKLSERERQRKDGEVNQRISPVGYPLPEAGESGAKDWKLVPCAEYQLPIT